MSQYCVVKIRSADAIFLKQFLIYGGRSNDASANDEEALLLDILGRLPPRLLLKFLISYITGFELDCNVTGVQYELPSDVVKIRSTDVEKLRKAALIVADGGSLVRSNCTVVSNHERILVMNLKRYEDCDIFRLFVAYIKGFQLHCKAT